MGRKLCNSRGIYVTCPIRKSILRILINRLESGLQRINKTKEFSADRLCVDHIFVLKRVLKEQTTELIFVDLEKAYGSVSLWKVLKI